MKLKRPAALTLFLVLLFSLAACGSRPTHPYTQEYVAGQGNIKGNVGNVNTADFLARDERFAIGATKDGIAVFKDPDGAYQALTEKYADGLALIRQEKVLLPLSTRNYQAYKTYGWQVTGGSQEAQSQARFISRFFDIYENSYV